MKSTKKLIESPQSSNEIIKNMTEGLKVRDIDRSTRQGFMDAGDFPDGTPPQFVDLKVEDVDWESFNHPLRDENMAYGWMVFGYEEGSGGQIDIGLHNGGQSPRAEIYFIKGVRDLDEGLKVLYSLRTPLTKSQLRSKGFQES